MLKIHRIKKITAAALCVVLLSQSACAAPQDAGAPSDADHTSAAPVPGSPEQADAESALPAAKEKHADFYGEVNAEWFATHPLKPGKLDVTCHQDAEDLLTRRFEELFANASPDDFAEDDPMRKLCSFYLQMKEEGPERSASMARIRELTDAIEAPENLNQFYDKVLKDPDFSAANNLMYVDSLFCDDCRYRVRYYTIPLTGLYMEKSEEEKQFMINAYSKMLLSLGYSAQDSLSMAQNALKVDGMVWEYFCNSEPQLTYFEDGCEELQACSFPFMDIQKARGHILYLYSEGDSSEYSFFAPASYLDFMQELFVSENLQMLKDYYVICFLERIPYMGNTEFMTAYGSIIMDFSDIPEKDRVLNEDPYLETAAILKYDTGAANKWYTDHYLTEPQKSEILALADELNGELQQIVTDIGWAAPSAQITWCKKVEKTECILGSYEEYNDLSDAEIGATSVDTLLSISRSNRAYNKRFFRGMGLKPDTTSANLSSANAYYLRDSSAIAIGNTMLLETELLGPNASYEEKLATIGITIAHELAHSLDANNIYLDDQGVYGEWYNDAYDEHYRTTIASIYDFYDGLTTAHGNTIKGGSIYNETFCDLVAMQCCLQALSKREHADYDAFFRAFAKHNALAEAPQYEQVLLRSDGHLPTRERVNYLLGQFPEFYETYEIDEASPYFVPEEKRIRLFLP